MARSTMNYICRMPDGTEFGPVDQATLITWVRQGRITPETEIRNALMRRWVSPLDIDFLADMPELNEVDPDETKNQEKAKAAKKDVVAVGPLHVSGKFKFTASPAGLRFGAWLMDTAIIGFVGLIVFMIVVVNGTGEIENSAHRTFTAILVAVFLFYHALATGFRAQTVGQWFYGIFVVRTGGDEVLMGRAFAYAVCSLLLFWSSVLAALVPEARSLQDLICGVRVIRTRLIEA